MSITQSQGEAALAAARHAAAAIGVPMNIAILDSGVHLKAFSRMVGALLGSIDIALGKARTADLSGLGTEAIREFSKPGGTSPGLELTNGALVVFAGGLPIRDETGVLLGFSEIEGRTARGIITRLPVPYSRATLRRP
ncbi:GlcG/HbpS family heme-binding protein [Sinorhizobium meliloti]|uniref:GlcG/HbpS family heme-binding protein n=1 Tax=Rhizobium meliloti TaxID=382 RepID=UPI003F13EF09